MVQEAACVSNARRINDSCYCTAAKVLARAKYVICSFERILLCETASSHLDIIDEFTGIDAHKCVARDACSGANAPSARGIASEVQRKAQALPRRSVGACASAGAQAAAL
jgi:hypothetical protein